MNALRPLFQPALIIGILLVSCSEQPAENEAGTSTPVSEAVSSVPVAPVAAADANAVVSDPNPAHGEPGHRCEIPVGASLSSAPAADAVNAAPSTSVMMDPATMPTATGATAPGMNPPHGEPGHDCNVAVGAPLPK